MMTSFIKVGGIAIITAVLGIFVFIFFQILPLFRGARVTPYAEVAAPSLAGGVLALGVDEWGEVPFVIAADGAVHFTPLDGSMPRRIAPVFESSKTVSAAAYRAAPQKLLFGTADGYFSLAAFSWTVVDAGDTRSIEPTISPGPFLALDPELASANGDTTSGTKITHVDFAFSGGDGMVAAIGEKDGHKLLLAALISQRQTLMGGQQVSVAGPFDLTALLASRPEQISVSGRADGLAVATETGEVYSFAREDDALKLTQVFTPFKDQTSQGISGLDFLFGGASLVVTNYTGVNRLFSLYIESGTRRRAFGQTKEFQKLPAAAGFYAGSLRNKSFLTGSGRFASLRYGTTGTTRWQETLPFTVRAAVLNAKNTRMIFLGNDGKIHAYTLDDPHPEAGWQAFFGKIWYEGAPEPRYEWQSTGGSDDFETKLSLVPLIFGTLKGTLYAMIFSIPMALLAAIYTSQFLNRRFKRYVKPAIELMASIPSVVLGFLGALWLAPLIEHRVPFLLVFLVLLPSVSFLFGSFWHFLEKEKVSWIRPGYEFLFFFPVVILVIWAAWGLGPEIERALFVVTDPATGVRTADFTRWWPAVTGLPYEQRNSLVVGFVMGFAVIPIIYTIAEDSFSNVPMSLRSASLALGASRWQTAVRVVLPTASAGIFSALMVGLGRAVGETMIVVMATGNTPVMEWNIFSGMRTLSANIAVELPEAPHLSTLYRTLFLGAMVLFLMTFAFNTLADVLRHRLREKYKTV